MPRIITVASLAMLFLSCGALRKHPQKVKNRKAGFVYCEAKKSKDVTHMNRLAKKHRLVREDWDAYCDAMEKQNYSKAFDIAKRKSLGREAERKAGFPYAWDDIRNGFVYVAHMTIEKIGLDDSERRIFGSTAFAQLMSARECIKAVEVVQYFDLPERSFVEALSCIEQERGITSALLYACLDNPSSAISAEYKARYLSDLSGQYASKNRFSDFGEVLIRCDWNSGDLEGFLIFLRQVDDIELALKVLEKLRLYLNENKIYAIARSLFDQAIACSGPDMAEEVRKAYPEAIDLSQKQVLLDEFISRRKCPEALALTYRQELSDVAIEKVFSSSMCRGSEFDRFARVLSPHKPKLWKKYFFLAMRYKRFVLARTLVDKASEAMEDSSVNLYAMLIDTALADNAHALLLSMEPPPNESRESYKAHIFEHALANGEEWTAATYAGLHHPNPEAIIERAYLRAMERGAVVLGAQIAKTYGDPKRLEDRARLAFELAMLARRPKDAQFIMRITGLRDSERRRRAGLLRYRQRRDLERKARRAKKRHKRKKKRELGDWSVRRE